MIEHQPGADADVGPASAAKPPPDGCTFRLVSVASHAVLVNISASPDRHFAKSFAPAALLANATNAQVAPIAAKKERPPAGDRDRV